MSDNQQMTALERVLAVITGKTPDYVPVFPMLNEYAAKLLGISELDYYKNPQRLAEGQWKLVNRFKYDFLLPFTYLAREAAALGSRIQFEKETSPTIGGILCKTPDELLQLNVPDFFNNVETKVVLEQIKQLTGLAGGKYPIIGVATGPFSWPTLIMGNDQWLTSLIMEEKTTIQKVIDKAIDYVCNWANAQIESGCHGIAMVEGSATKSVIPEDVFLEFVQPALIQCCKRIKGPIFLMGVGGEFEPYLSHINKTGVTGVVISTDDNLRGSIEKSPELVIMGNVNNLEFFDYSLQDIETITKSAMEIGKNKKYIFSTQYVLPNLVKEEQIDYLIQCARKYGKL